MRRLVALLVLLSAGAFAPAITSKADIPPPNLVLVLTDDQRFDDLASMPTVQSELINKGVDFHQAFVTNPLCCPSRTSILTGKYSHSTQVYSNKPVNGGYETFHGLGEDRSTIATWLHTGLVNYRTAMIGKYLNGYTQAHIPDVGPGWNRWVAWAPVTREAPGYYHYPVSIDGVERDYGSTDAAYSTDVYANYAKTFIKSMPPGRPLFLYFAPRAPHGPSTPPTRYLNACPGVTNPHYPDYGEADVSDKPPYIQARPPTAPGEGNAHYLHHCQSLLAVDDAVNTIIDALSSTGRLSNTMIVFMSDNGIQIGEHNWFDKRTPYDESIRVPMIVRYDPLTNGVATSDTTHFVLNVDLAQTFAQLAGVQAPGAEGMSLVPLLDGTAQSWRSDFLIEHADAPNAIRVPTYCAVRSQQYMYTKYEDGFEELYDLNADPFELQNVASDPNYATVRSDMYARMLELCQPPPPGYVP